MKRILIIEDDKNIQELLRQELNDEGYAITITGLNDCAGLALTTAAIASDSPKTWV